MTYISGALFMAFCGLCGVAMEQEHAAEVAIALAALIIMAAEWDIYREGK